MLKFTDLGKAISIVRQAGARKAIQHSLLAVRNRLMEWEDRNIEKKAALDTGSPLRVEQMQIGDHDLSHAHDYVPTYYRIFDFYLKNLPDDLSDYNFVDLGSGKGRVLLRAAKQGLKAVYGVEICKDLHDIALQNATRLAERDSSSSLIHCVHANVANFQFPPGNLICYLCNPFGKSVMENVVMRLEKLVADSGRHVIVLFMQTYPEYCESPELLSVLESSSILSRKKISYRNITDRLLLGSHLMTRYDGGCPDRVGLVTGDDE